MPNKSPARLWSESERSAALHSYDVLDTPREAEFDELARVASDICGTPIAVVNLVDTTRQFFKAEIGLGVRSTPLESAICAHALLEEDIMVIPDATRDKRLECNPLVTEAPHLRAYAGALLKTAAGLPIGTICVLDYQPRQFTETQIRMLKFLARQTMAQLELRRRVAAQRALLIRAKRAERDRAHFERIVRQASDFIGMADRSGKVVFLNEAARDMLGIDAGAVVPSHVDGFIAEEDLHSFRQEVVPLIRSGESFDREIRLRNFRTGETFPALYTMFPLRSADGEIVGYGVVTKDISEQKKEEERRAHLISEAAHRMKNTLAIVEAIVSQTLKNASSLEHGRQSISNRVRALAQAQDILCAAEGTAADIITVIESALMPHDPGDLRVRYAGPSHPLSAAQSLGLSLAIHELATNAAKYGALKGDSGNVEIGWTVSGDGDFFLEWKENGGLPVVAPVATGFGSKLIQGLVAPYFGGTAVHEFLPDGVRFTLAGKLPVGEEPRLVAGA